MRASIYFNVIISGVLTGLVYGLMALGLSVIFGVVRVVNFAHGEMMTIAMYLAIVLFNTLGVDPLVIVIPLAGVLFVLGYALQAGIINPFINRPEHSQFILLVAIAIIITNVLLIVFGPDARSVQTSYSFDSFAIGPVIVDATKVYAGVRHDPHCRGAVRILSVCAGGQGDSCLRRQLYRRAGGGARRKKAVCAHLRHRRRLRRGSRLHDGPAHRRHSRSRTGIHACWPSSS